MKKTILSIAFMAISVMSFAQITDIKVADDVTFNRIYAGELVNMAFDDSLHAMGTTSFRAGIMGTYAPTQWISLKSFGMCQMEDGKTPWSVQQYWMKITPIKGLGIELGNMATLPTDQRPNPTTADGHIEPWAEKQITGMTVNAKIKYSLDSNLLFAAGIANRNNLPEYSGKIQFKKIQFSGWYTAYSKETGAALTIDNRKLHTTFVVRKNVIADIFLITLNEKKGISLYSDMGYDPTHKKLIHGEWGLRKAYQSKYLKGIFQLTYDAHKINASFFAHL